MEGLYIPLITPFTADDRIDLAALEKLADRLLGDGARGLVVFGTTGEPATLTAGEKRDILSLAATICRDHGAELVVGAGGNDTRTSVEALRALAKTPEVTAALTVVPYYTRPGQAGVVEHFRMLATESPVPLVIYNIPYRTGQTLSWQTICQLADIPGIIGTKHAVGAIDDDTVGLMAAKPREFSVLAGDDLYASPLLALGGSGAILASAHLATDQFAALVRAWLDGDATGGRELGHRLAPLSAALFTEPNPTVIKAALHAAGQLATPAVRLPLLPASPEALEAYEAHVVKMN
ncbi:4-hydroxy-tetrahydrodipicolinate synthase [Fodinicola acaciae]|uniref:4-hydroxy-tetrahydrodipicolinate synthase n=1 Tax=Fodinicola acaciae TaxID=2681555 RepID=UPI0013CFD765|nr:4-hydroxy-tetrahydrodipicolinate synthase [Fodinicola acaciae]